METHRHRPLNILSADQIRQIEIIRRSVPADKPLIAFFCPTKSFRNQFGEVPELLKSAGHSVIKLYGEPANDAFESSPESFPVWGAMVGQMDFVDLIFVPTIMDCLPPRAKKILFHHISFAETEFEQSWDDSKKAAHDLSYEGLLAKHKHLHAFLPLYDYIAVSSSHIKQHMEGILDFYGRGPAKNETPETDACAKLLDGLAGHRLAKTQTIIPAGYPPIDCAARTLPAIHTPEKIITYAPTPLAGKPSWEPFASARSHGPEIIKALLSGFPDYQIVFKPYPNDEPELIKAIVSAGKDHPRFLYVTKGGNHRELYDKTALMVSDFSSTAYTFALSRRQPVVFFSPNESQLPEAARNSAYCIHRNSVGEIAETLEELVSAGRRLLTNSSPPDARPDLLYNPGRSDLYLAEHIDDIIHDREVSQWDKFEGGAIAELSDEDSVFSPQEIADVLREQFGINPDGMDNVKSLFIEFQSCIRVLGAHQLKTLLPLLAGKIANSIPGTPNTQPLADIRSFINRANYLNDRDKNYINQLLQNHPDRFQNLSILLSWVNEGNWGTLHDLIDSYIIKQFTRTP